MYELVYPLVGEVCRRLGWDYHYEYCQPAGPNRSLKVDVAILYGDQPIWYVEAKKWEKRPIPEMVTGYLHDRVRGVVTNGNYWIFVAQEEQPTVIGPLYDADSKLQASKVEALLEQFSAPLSGVRLRKEAEVAETDRIAGPGPKVLRRSRGRGFRKFAEKTTYLDLPPAVEHARTFAAPGSVTHSFLSALHRDGANISSGRIEVSKNRLVWWDQNSERLLRINLKSMQLEVLIASRIVDWIGSSRISARLKVHDKNHRMVQCYAPTVSDSDSLAGVFEYPA